MDVAELEKQRFFTKMNLHECEVYSENRALTFGLQIASFVFSAIAILVSYGTITASGLLTAILVGPVIGIALFCCICQVYVDNRKNRPCTTKISSKSSTRYSKRRNKKENNHANV